MVISVLSGLYCVFRNIVTSFDFNPGWGAVFVFLVFVICIGPDADSGSTRQQPTRHSRGKRMTGSLFAILLRTILRLGLVSLDEALFLQRWVSGREIKKDEV
jgi:hypothetical protein